MCSGNVFVTLINTMTKATRRGKGLSGPYFPVTLHRWGLRARTEVELWQSIVCCLVPSGLLSSCSVWPVPLCLGMAPPHGTCSYIRKIKQSRKCPTDMPTGQADEGNPCNEVPSSQMTLRCSKLMVKTDQHTDDGVVCKWGYSKEPRKFSACLPR